VSKLSPSGNRDWVRVFRAINVEFSQHAVDASGAVYISGWFLGEIDLDPGPGEDLHDPISNWESGFLVKLDASGNFVWSKLVEGIDAQRMRGVSIAPDGTVWCFGTQPGSATLAGAPLSTGRGVFFASFDSAGTLGRTLALDVTAGADPPSRIAASTGAIHLGAQFWGDDLDPGAGRELRYASDPSAVLVSLDAIGTFRQAHLIAAYNPLPELAAAPAGGVLLGLQPGEVRAYYADGVSSWSLPIGDDFTLHRLASSTTHWIALGLEYGTADYDPGPGTATVYSNTLLVTRYAF
jgi:hypothetical protein